MNYTSGKEKLVHKKEAANRGFDHEGREREWSLQTLCYYCCKRSIIQLTSLQACFCGRCKVGSELLPTTSCSQIRWRTGRFGLVRDRAGQVIRSSFDLAQKDYVQENKRARARRFFPLWELLKVSFEKIIIILQVYTAFIDCFCNNFFNLEPTVSVTGM
jgi:hypothetical protein